MKTDLASTRPSGLPQPRRYDGINWVGLRTLYLREVRRFWKVGAQTVAAPVVTTLLYMLVFVVALKGARPPLHGTPFAEFVAPGLIMMAQMRPQSWFRKAPDVIGARTKLSQNGTLTTLHLVSVDS